MYSSLNIYNQPVTLAPTTVASPNAAYQRMANFWGLVEDLKEGTYKIRSEHRKYLNQEPRETDDAYDTRLARSTVVPYLQRIEKMLSGMLVRKPIRLDDVSDLVREQLFDVDLEGNDLNVWLYQTARVAISFGHVGVWLMHQKMEKRQGHIGLLMHQKIFLVGEQKSLMVLEN